MSEIVRVGDVTGFDDAEIIEIEQDVYVVDDGNNDEKGD